MADDSTLQKFALRIKDRAVRRCGELLKQFDGRGGHMKTDGVVSSQKQAARDAGLSERQQVTAVRVANIPGEDFAAAVESDDPPTVTKLADMGRKRHPEPPDGFREATKLIGTVERFAQFCGEHEPEKVAGGVLDYAAIRFTSRATLARCHSAARWCAHGQFRIYCMCGGGEGPQVARPGLKVPAAKAAVGFQPILKVALPPARSTARVRPNMEVSP